MLEGHHLLKSYNELLSKHYAILFATGSMSQTPLLQSVIMHETDVTS